MLASARCILIRLCLFRFSSSSLSARSLSLCRCLLFSQTISVDFALSILISRFVLSPFSSIYQFFELFCGKTVHSCSFAVPLCLSHSLCLLSFVLFIFEATKTKSRSQRVKEKIYIITIAYITPNERQQQP